MNKLTQLLILVIIASLSGVAGGLLVLQQVENLPLNADKEIIQETYLEESSTIDAIEKVGNSVVSIVASKYISIYQQDPFNFFFGNGNFSPNNLAIQKKEIGGGTGFIISKDGLILTNRHVVLDNQAEYTAITNQGKRYKLQILSKDYFNDIAILKIVTGEQASSPIEDAIPFETAMPADLTIAQIGNSDNLKIGQKVIAIGNALAEYNNTVTTGVISAKNRTITAGRYGSSEVLKNLLQTDAAINPGNSGGPLINLHGEIVGINVAIDASARGIGFAIPINDIKYIIDSIRKYGKIMRPYLGIRYIAINTISSVDFNIPTEITTGVLLVGNATQGEAAIIPDSPADQAGLLAGDIILQVDDITIDQNNDLNNLVLKYKVSDQINLKIYRNGKYLNKKLKLGSFE